MGRETSQGYPITMEQLLKLQCILVKEMDPTKINKQQAQAWIEEPEKSAEVVAALLKLTPTEALLHLKSIPDMMFPVWKTIQLGTHRTTKSLRDALQPSNFISAQAEQLLEKTKVAESPTQIKLCRASLDELGFPNGASFADIRAKIHQLGFADCPAEVGPQLRRQYTVQPLNDCVHIIMNPITASDSSLVFCVERSNCRFCLYSENVDTSRFFADSGMSWVFTRE